MKIKKILQSKEAYEILDNSNCAGSTWTSGGCAILAKALNKISNYPIFIIFNRNYKSPEHFGIKLPNGNILDADGKHKDEKHWIKFFVENELPRKGELIVLPYIEGMNLGDILFDEEASDELAKLIVLNEKSNLIKEIRGVVREVVGGDKIWYHGTPDIRKLEQEGGFVQKYINFTSRQFN
jgi:hypothetical protein